MDRLRRRTLLATLGSVSAGLAGCITDTTDGPPAQSDDTQTDDTQTDDTQTDDTQTDDDPPSDEEESDEPDEPDEPVDGYRPTIDYGELIDDFSRLSWDGFGGAEVFLDETEAVAGEHALRVEATGETYATAGYTFPEGLDLRGRHLSMAIKPEAPVGGLLEIRLRAPNNDHRLWSVRRLPPALDDWIRVDFGFTQGIGSPQLDYITDIRVQLAGSDETNVRFWIDDVRATDGVGESHAILVFYGALESYYETVYPILEERGMTAAVAVRPAAIGTSDRMSVDQLHELQDAGWDICSFPIRPTNLPEMSAEDQRTLIEGDKFDLEHLGFEDGARHFFAPRHSINGDTLDVLWDTHDTGFLFGGNSAAMPPTEPLAIPTINGEALDSSRAAILRADLHEQLVVLGFSGIGGDRMSVEDFQAQLDRVESNDYAGGLNVITPSTLLDDYL